MSRRTSSSDQRGRADPGHRTIASSPGAIPVLSAAGVWAVDADLTTLFASPGFARLVGINRLVLSGLPWFILVPDSSLPALEWLVTTWSRRPSAILDLRPLDGGRVPAVVHRVYGGPGRDKTVLRVFPLDGADRVAITVLPRPAV